MNVLNKLRIGTRLALAFGLVALLMITLAATAKIGLASIHADMDQVINDRYAKVKVVTDINNDVNLHARVVRNAVMMETEAERAAEIQRLKDTRPRITEAYDELRKLLNTPKGIELFDLIQVERKAFIAAEDELIRLLQAGDIAAGKALLLQTLRPRQLAYQKRLEDMTKFQEGLMAKAAASTFTTIDRVTVVTLVAAVAGLALALVSGMLVTKSITRPVSDVVTTLQTVASGDLTVVVDVDRGDEVGELQRALRDTVAALRRLVSEVRAGVDSVTTASSEIAEGNQDLSSRTEQQASSLQETASSMEELTATVRQSADTARAASNLAANASAAATHGGDVVSQVVGTMDEISASSRKIGDIIGVIDSIAFQTNILALNAAVEAARAGEQGRGFAVVAGEVRVLAQRSAEAAREIKSLISASSEKVEAGSRQVADAGQAMQEIVEQVRKVNDLIGEIASTTGEQSRGIEQVNTAVTQMDQVTQQNAALVEESAAAAASLAHQAQALAQAVALFRVEGGSARAMPSAVAAATPPATVAMSAPRPSAAPARRAAKAAPPPVAPAGDLAWESF